MNLLPSTTFAVEDEMEEHVLQSMITDERPRMAIGSASAPKSHRATAFAGTEALRIDLLGGLCIHRHGRAIDLTGSRKARALLAYLLITGRSHRRERLCDLFWDAPDDPRGALRTALVRIRALVDEPGAPRLTADRERVALPRTGVAIDYLDLMAQFEGPGPFVGTAVAAAIAALDQKLLADVDLPESIEFQSWLAGARADAATLRQRLLALSVVQADDDDAAAALGTTRQKINYAVAADGVRIAYASVGDGPLLIKAPNWLNHLELDWSSPVWSPLLLDLARDFRVVRHDARGNGLSSWTVPDMSLDAFVSDLEAVVEASGCERFALLGMSQGVAVAIEYAARHPDRVSHLVLWGGYAAGWRVDGDEALRAEREALMVLFHQGWGSDDATYRQLFSRAFMPLASNAELAAFDAVQQATTTPENALRALEMFADIDVRDRLAGVTAPTLVMHARDDKRVPFIQSARIAAGLPNAEFITLPTGNHFLIGREAAYAEFIAQVRAFLAPAG